jgi:hypothetical protein
MKNFIAAVALVVGLALPHLSQAASVPAGAQLGYFDQTTATFKPLITPKVVPASSVVRTGTVKVTITLTLQSVIGPESGVSCGAGIGAFDASFDNTAGASNVPVVISGSTGTVTITIPYAWTMAASGEQATVSANCNEFATVDRFLTFILPGFVVPTAPGTVTKISLKGTM